MYLYVAEMYVVCLARICAQMTHLIDEFTAAADDEFTATCLVVFQYNLFF